MVLPWALAVLSLLPLLEAQSPACANLTAKPITNATLDWLSGRWFYISSVFLDPAFKQMVQKVQASDFYFTPNLTQDTILFHDDHCEYNSSVLWVHRENATLSRYGEGLSSGGRGTYLLAFSMDDEKKRGLSLYANKPEATPEQLEGFREALQCKGMDKSEIMYTDWKKDQCEPLRRQHQLERKKEPESSPGPPTGGHSSEPPAP
uniref:Lipocalin/cytosolic fatty-acid binding domain-containing protein n=1 Tax=Marmota marmota marmota TaxID=9994 RepID=A0A8C6EMJ2_MARMA